MGSASIRDESPGVPAEASRIGAPRLPDFEAFDLAVEHDLLAAERLVERAKKSEPARPDDSWQRHDAAHGRLLAGWHVSSPAPPAANSAPQAEPAQPASEGGVMPWIAWTIVALGVSIFACGGILWIWSFAGDRPDLARFGLPLVLGGQAALILGLMLQLESLWQSTQQATQSLDVLDDRVAEITHATTLLGTTHSPSSASFYSHYAQGASPHLLLADLKGQLDLLALKMGRQR
jgi:hypothetical protein